MHALVFTDLVESTALGEALGDGQAAALWNAHDEQARELLARCNGLEIDHSDGFFLIFEDPLEAVRFAIAYHVALDGLNLAARIGIHAGNVTIRSNSEEAIARGAKRFEVDGAAKPLAARVMALAQPRQTLITGSAWEEIAGRSVDVAARPYGFYRLKGIADPVDVAEVVSQESIAIGPPPDADKAYRVVRDGELWRPGREIRHNLPAHRDAFVGRSAELQELGTRVQGGSRLINILGTGGMGKTRLATRYAFAWLGEWPGGVYFCDLSEARSLDGILFAVARSLQIGLQGTGATDHVGAAIAGRGRCLLVLDNFEQVSQFALATLGAWLDAAPDAVFLVTSRQRLGLQGEELLVLESLPLSRDAIELFSIRARAQKADFEVNEANKGAVERIVRMLDGMPLAIELAAARVRVLPPRLLAEKLSDRLGIAVAGPASGRATRQATLRAAIDWSWHLLEASEQAALGQCSIFEGSFTLAAFEATISLPGASPSVSSVLEALVDKSLVRVMPVQGHQVETPPRFGLYLSIQEYATAKLREDGQAAADQTEHRHGQYYATFGTDSAIEELVRHGGTERRQELAADLDNLAVACRRSLGQADGDIAVMTYRASWEVLELQGPFGLGVELGAKVLAQEGLPTALRVRAANTHGRALWRAGHTAEAERTLLHCLDLCLQADDRVQEAKAQLVLLSLRREQGRLDEDGPRLQASLAIAEARGDRSVVAAIRAFLGNEAFQTGRMDDALDHYERALDVLRETGDLRAEANILGNLGSVHAERGNRAQSRSHNESALVIHRRLGNRRFEAIVLGNLGALEFAEGRMREARAHLGLAHRICREIGDRRGEGFVLAYLSDLHEGSGERTQALALLEQALRIHQDLGSRMAEGMVLGGMARLLSREGRVAEGRVAADRARVLLQEAGDPLELGKALCIRAELETMANEQETARSALATADALFQAAGVGVESELGQAIAEARARFSAVFEPAWAGRDAP